MTGTRWPTEVSAGKQEGEKAQAAPGTGVTTQTVWVPESGLIHLKTGGGTLSSQERLGH